MIAIIIGLIIALVIIVVVVNGIQQHREKVEAEKRVRISKQKAIIDETEELILTVTNLPPNPGINTILNRRMLNAAKEMLRLSPESKNVSRRIEEIEARIAASDDLATAQTGEEAFVLPDNEQQLIAILQCIKKLRAVLKSEQSKGALDAQTFTREDQRLNSMQLKINIESLLKRGDSAYSKEMVGSARQYYEKALQTLSDHPVKNDYVIAKQEEIKNKLEEIAAQLRSSNAQDRAKKAKEDEDELDMLFQPKKKW
ncbi:hypothetical protein SG34_010745 [Thalassomonas viridans]|uniref:DNA repair protein n=1 Tax=Thalassomonas viridans TaxID=137584 RepID=A0AAF0CB97_9GAMM|nr:hypothetical protein [Thalassomonas viridans]WDE07321.1 hypothetical protein SG34_010745 [Thalassomonas viridans]